MQSTDGLSYAEGDPIATGCNYPTWQQRFLDIASSYPDNTALVSMYQPPLLYSIPSQPLESPEYALDPYLRWTYRSLKVGIERFADGLKTKGIESGMLVVTMLSNSAEQVLAMMAAQLLGCVYVPLASGHITNKDEISHLLGLIHDGLGGSRTAIIVRDIEIASQLDALQHESLRCAVKIVCGSTSDIGTQGWHTFDHIMAHSSPLNASETGVYSTLGGDLILCTSGTTSLPKAVMLTIPQTSYLIYTLDSNPYTNLSCTDVMLGVSPHNHIMGWFSLNSALLFGGTLVLPSIAFSIEAITRAVVGERVTISSLAPTVVRMLAEAGCDGLFSGLRSLSFGGAVITPDILDIATRKLGAKQLGAGYGATEGSIMRTGTRDLAEIISGNDVAVALRPEPGMAIKVCREGSPSDILPLGHPGELHISSPGTCRGYIGQENTDSFYQDKSGRRWQNMGDMARIEPDGKLIIVGRYKDLINRGGEKISPAAIEAVLAREHAFTSLDIQVVGAPDDIAGEVPVALTKTAVSADVASAIRETIVSYMGPSYAPDEVIALENLGLKDYPRTPLGKVQKSKLSALVRAHYQQSKPAIDESNSTLEKIKVIWSRALGLDPARLSSDTQVAEYADSIAFMRVRDRINKAMGKTLSLKELASAATIGDEVRLLESKPVNSENARSWHTAVNARDGPPGIDDIIHLTEAPDLFETTKQVVEESLQNFDPTLTWNDVRDVMPAYDFIRVSYSIGLMNHMNLKIPWLTKRASVEELRAALEVVFKNNPMMASFLVEDKARLPDLTLMAIARQSPSIMDQIIVDKGVLKTVAEMQEFARHQHYPECSDAMPPAPLTKVSLFFIEETKSAGLVLNGNHTVYDATLVGLILEDLEAALAGQMNLVPHQNYKLWSDVYYSLRKSPAARAAVKYFSDTRRGLEKHKQGIWPTHPPVYLPRDIRLATDAPDGFTHIFDVPGLHTLRASHPAVAPAMLLKAALALFLRHQTGHTHAVFAQVEADRLRWPFLPGVLGEQSASDVGGQTIQSTINVVAPEEGETVLEFLRHLQSDQVLQTRYAAAPRLLVIQELGEEAGGLLPWIGSTAVFNWLGHPMTRTPLQHLESFPAEISSAVFSFFLACGMTASEGLWMKVRGATFGLAELGQFARELESLARWLVKEENWERKVSESQEVWA